jgi:electron transfer flavoprotein beta subunit
VSEIGEPPYAALPEMMRGLRATIPTWGLADIDLPPDEVGLAGSPTQVRQVFAPPQRQSGDIIGSVDGNADKIAHDLLEHLLQDGVLED